MQPSVAWILFYVVIYLGVASGPCGLHRPDHDDALLTGVPRTRCTSTRFWSVWLAPSVVQTLFAPFGVFAPTLKAVVSRTSSMISPCEESQRRLDLVASPYIILMELDWCDRSYHESAKL